MKKERKEWREGERKEVPIREVVLGVLEENWNIGGLKCTLVKGQVLEQCMPKTQQSTFLWL